MSFMFDFPIYTNYTVKKLYFIKVRVGCRFIYIYVQCNTVYKTRDLSG